jgi:hypothetical protein
VVVLVRHARGVLFVILLTALVVKVVWWVLQPMLPYVLVGLVIVWIFAFVIRRGRRW